MALNGEKKVIAAFAGDLEEAHAKARKELGGGDSLSEKQFRNELCSFIRQGFLEEVLSASGKSHNPKLYKKHDN